MTPPVLISLAYTRCSTLELGDSPASVDLLLSPIFRGVKGDPGDAGPGAGPIQTFVGLAATVLSGHRIVGLKSDGTYGYVDAGTPADGFKAAGITTGAAAAGQPVTVQSGGPLIEPSWSWTVDAPVYLGLNGMPTQVVPQRPASVFAEIIGVAISPTQLFVRIQPPIYLT